MEIIGLTGGIGTGKSTASDYLAQSGFFIIDADQIAHEIAAPGMPLLEELRQAFGSAIIKKDGSLDRKGLAALVFRDVSKRKLLDSIMHGRIIDVIEERIKACKEQDTYRGIVIDAPLLFETGLEKKCGQVWLLTADKERRIKRVCERDEMTPNEVEDRMRNQLDDAKKQKRADVVIDNSGSLTQLRGRLDGLLKALEL